MIREITIQRKLSERYASGKQRFSYKDIAAITGTRYAPGEFRDGIERTEANRILEDMSREGLIRLRTEGKKEGAVVYNGTFLPAMEKLCCLYGIETKEAICETLEKTLKRINIEEGAVKKLVDKTLDDIRRTGKYDAKLFDVKYDDLPDILKGADAVLKNRSETYIRDISKRIYNHSKRLGELKPQIEKFVKTCSSEEILNRFSQMKESGLGKSILALYSVIPCPYPILFEGEAIIETDRGEIHTLGYPHPFISNRVKDIRKIYLTEPLIIFENKTTYMDFQEAGKAKMFSGGFPGMAEKQLLEKIYSCNEHLKFYHWGDIDAGGINIFYDLKKVVPTLRPHNMDMHMLYHCKENGLTTPLTENDRKRIMNMQNDKIFSGVIKTMLEENCKVEQEAFYA